MLDHDGIERHGIKAIAKALLFLLFVGFGTGWRRCLWMGYYKMIFAMLKRNDLTLMTRELYGERWELLFQKGLVYLQYALTTA